MYRVPRTAKPGLGACRWRSGMGLDARLIAANFVSPYRMEGRSGKNDMTDAETGHKQSMIEDASNELTGLARLVVQRAFEHWRELDEHMKWCDQQIGAHVRGSDDAKRAAKIIGIGEIGASALIAGVGDFKQFKGGHQFGAWLGLVPSQNASGGEASLGRITKRGDNYLRTLLIQGAKSAVMSAGKRDDSTSKWLQQLTARVGWQKACVAMANKNARILWEVMTREAGFDAKHVSVKPPGK